MIETISYIARTLSLGLRLTANMIGSLALIFLMFLLFIIFDSVNYTEFVIIYSFLPTFIYNTDNNSQDSQDVPNKETKVSAVIIYSNTEVNRSQILSDNKGSGGIYMWTHKESGKRYVGSVVDLSKRLSKYYSSSVLKRVDNYISRALLYHTHSAFSLTILEIISISSSVEETRKLILEREQFYIDTLGPEYNILKIAGSLLGFIHSDESKVKMSEAKKGEKSQMFGKTGKNHPFFGKTHTVESKAKISLANFGKTHSIGSIAKIRIALRGEKNPMSKSVFVYSFDSETKDIILYKSFNTCIEAAKYFDCSTRILSRYLDKNKLYKNQ
jgi:group I intron endonuclease